MAITESSLSAGNIGDQVVAVVLGGGRGTRLYPLTAQRAKPAVPLCGRYRLVDIPLSNCLYSGVNRIFVLTQFNSVSLNRHINRSYKFDTFSRGFVEILAAELTVDNRDWYQGTADAIRKQLRHVANLRAKHCLILAGDHLYHMDYRPFLATHIRRRADISVAVVPITREDASGVGVLKIRSNGRVHRFVEKPSSEADLEDMKTPATAMARQGLSAPRGEYLASMGVYVFRTEVLEAVLQDRPDWIDFGHDVIPKSLRERRVFSYIFDGYWEDIGTVRSYYDASMEIASAHPPFEFQDPHYVVYTRPRYLAGSRVQKAAIEDSIVCEGSRIANASISNSIIGIRSIVQPGAKVHRSVIMGADFYESRLPDASIPVGIGPDSEISGAIIDKNARIGRGVVIRGSRKLKDKDGPGYAIRDGIVVVIKNAVIPDGTRIG